MPTFEKPRTPPKGGPEEPARGELDPSRPTQERSPSTPPVRQSQPVVQDELARGLAAAGVPSRDRVGVVQIDSDGATMLNPGAVNEISGQTSTGQLLRLGGQPGASLVVHRGSDIDTVRDLVHRASEAFDAVLTRAAEAGSIHARRLKGS